MAFELDWCAGLLLDELFKYGRLGCGFLSLPITFDFLDDDPSLLVGFVSYSAILCYSGPSEFTEMFCKTELK